MNFTLLPPALHKVAESAELVLRARLQLNQASVKIEEPFDKNISWSPTFWWKLPTGVIIACEVTAEPLPVIILQNWSDLMASGISIKIITAYTLSDDLSSKKYQSSVSKARSLGIGLLTVDIDKDYTGKLEYQGVSLPLILPKIDTSKFKNIFHKYINDCYDLYMGGDPKHGVQELGQIIENILNAIAVKVNQKDNNKLKAFASAYHSNKHYALNKLIEDMLNENTLSKVFLKKCASFADMRNATSHKAKTLADTKRIEKNFKTSFDFGLQILEELPTETKNAGFSTSILK